MSKLNLDPKVIASAREAAGNIAKEMQSFIDKHTTVSTERTIARLFGVDGTDDVGVPMPNILVDHIKEGGGLSKGICFWLGNAMVQTGLKPQEIAEKVAAGELNLMNLDRSSETEIEKETKALAVKAVEKIKAVTAKRNEYLKNIGEGDKPYLYVIVATGNIYEDVLQAEAAVAQGADVVAVIRTTGQSLLDYVPYGPTTEGFGGTYATQENFKIMREALDRAGEKAGRYVRLCNYSSGLCMAEIAAMGAMERLDMMLNDALYGILFRDINMQRTLVDQYFSRVIIGFSDIIINTGEDNYLTTADAVEEAHTVIASQFMNEQFALIAGVKEEQMGLGHAFEISPLVENGLLYEWAQAAMARELFPKAPLKYMPPTKFMTGDIFKGNVQDALFNFVSIASKQGIQLLGMPTEAIHTPHIQDRMLAIENAQYLFHTAKDLNDEIEFKKDGIMQKRAQEVLAKAETMLKNIEKDGLFKTIEHGKFADVKRPLDGGKGLDGVTVKEAEYRNPFIELMLGGGK